MITIVTLILIIIVLGAIAIDSFPGGSGSIHFDDVRCTGNESKIVLTAVLESTIASILRMLELAVALKVCVYNCIHVVPNKGKAGIYQWRKL